MILLRLNKTSSMKTISVGNINKIDINQNFHQRISAALACDNRYKSLLKNEPIYPYSLHSSRPLCVCAYVQSGHFFP